MIVVVVVVPVVVVVVLAVDGRDDGVDSQDGGTEKDEQHSALELFLLNCCTVLIL